MGTGKWEFISNHSNVPCARSLGQNFLTDDGILENIVSSAGVLPGDLVLEVRSVDCIC